jgi:diguanylate cyclase (GGDEF)-like protein
MVAVLAIAATILAAFVGHTALPALPFFIPSVMTAVALVYFLTAFHLWRLYVLTGRRRLGALGSTFTLTGLLVLVYLITFPGVIPLTGYWAAVSNSATWFWLLWHLAFPIGIVASLLVDDHERLVVPAIEQERNRRVLISAVQLPLLTGLIAIFIIVVEPYLPDLLKGTDYSMAQTWLQIPLALLDGLAFVFVFARGRHGTILDRWLIVCVLITFCDAQINLAGLHLYSLDWYLSRTLGLIAASIILFALLDDFARIYGNLALTHDALRRAAETDPLTRLASRVHALNQTTRLLGAQTPFCLAILDLDHFKAVNDTHGHLVGDDVLRVVGARLIRTLKADDLVGRLGGEEFILLLPNIDISQARAVAERVLSTLRSSPIATRAGSIGLTASLGLAAFVPGESLDALLARADVALYRAKNAGRDRFEIAE